MSKEKEEIKKEDEVNKPELLSSDQEKKEDGSVKYPESEATKQKYYYIEA